MVAGTNILKKKKTNSFVPPKTEVKNSKEDKIFIATIGTVATILVVLVAYPLVYTVMASFSDPLEIVSGSLFLIPKKYTFKAYQAVMSNPDILIGYQNTIFYTIVGTILNLLMTTLAAYPLSRKDIPGRRVMTVLITITMFFSGGMISTCITIRNLHMINTSWAMLLPGVISVSNMLIMKNYFEYSVPEELVEAAYIDGCSNTRTLISVVIPVVKSIIGVLTVYYFVGHWNMYFKAFLYLTERARYPLQVFLRQMLIQDALASDSGSGDSVAVLALLTETMKYSLIVVASVPALIIYPLMQKFFDKGIMIGAVKG